MVDSGEKVPEAEQKTPRKKRAVIATDEQKATIAAYADLLGIEPAMCKYDVSRSTVRNYRKTVSEAEIGSSLNQYYTLRKRELMVGVKGPARETLLAILGMILSRVLSGEMTDYSLNGSLKLVYDIVNSEQIFELLAANPEVIAGTSVKEALDQIKKL